MSGDVLDDLTLIAGLAGAGSEHQRRELSRLLHGAIDGGPALDMPALCLTAATVVRPSIADHIAEIVASAPVGAIVVCGLTRTDQAQTDVGRHPGRSVAYSGECTVGRIYFTTC